MKTSKIRIFALGIACVLAAIEVAASSDASLRVASYNVRNYLAMDRIVAGKWRPDYPKPESEKQVVRASIIEADPDILALQEIGSLEHLEELRRDLASEGLVYDGFAWMEAHDPDRCLAALWKKGIDIEVREHPNLPIRYFGKVEFVKRGMLELRVEDSKGGWSLYNLHLKSKYTTLKSDPLSTKRRTLESRSARDRIIELNPQLSESRFIITGDLNDSPASAAFRALNKRGDRIIGVPIRCVDANGSTWTHYYKKEDLYGRIDYFLASLGWRLPESFEGSILTRTDFYRGSDHRLIWIDVSSDALLLEQDAN